MKKIKVLEVNNIDLPGKVFNGYDFISNFEQNKFDIKQAVIIKQSNNKNVIKILNTNDEINLFEKFQEIENKLSIHNILSITSDALRNLLEYKEADIIHFHMFHNTKLSIPSLKKIANEKKVVITLHDPWLLSGHCVHYYDCNEWKNGCNMCNHLETLFPLLKDNSSFLWQIKKEVINNIDLDIVVTSNWMLKNVKESPIFSKTNKVHLIPIGIDTTKYVNNGNQLKIRKLYKINHDNIVLFLRAQNEFKGTEYVLEALKLLKSKKSLTIITCDQKGLLDEVKGKYQIIDLGIIEEEEIIAAMNACDIFLMPSKAESFGMMAIEAMACSRPIIVFNNTALPSVTFAPKCGYLVNNRNSKDLMKAIKHLIDNPQERFDRGNLGRNICEKYYSYNKYINTMQQLYKKIYNMPKIIKKEKSNINYKKEKNYFSLLHKYIKGKNDNLDKIIFSKNDVDLINQLNSDIYIKIIHKNYRKVIYKKIKSILKKINAFIKHYKNL